ncbi:hypothetical protein DAEQUDRAFT_813241 [Daedalea quercina L-15889]|uniref:Uncharacterized protein n=1 Tax=Daedalea quercina L-15889 TaxID=1314783 RepID=A0A165NGT1_9APHY|nr:hypothetical protein DAEQUDRAFT_813241 [Daedalea quercina L-15889]
MSRPFAIVSTLAGIFDPAWVPVPTTSERPPSAMLGRRDRDRDPVSPVPLLPSGITPVLASQNIGARLFPPDEHGSSGLPERSPSPPATPSSDV